MRATLSMPGRARKAKQTVNSKQATPTQVKAEPPIEPAVNDKTASVCQNIQKKLQKKIQAGATVSEAGEYICQCSRSNLEMQQAIFQVAANINPDIAKAALALDREIKNRSFEKNNQKLLLMKENNDSQTLAEKIGFFHDKFLEAKINGDEIRWGVRLEADLREHFFNSDEAEEIIQLRSTGILMSNVQRILGCTRQQLNRFCGQGKLPWAYKSTIEVKCTKVLARFWLKGEVLSAKAGLEEWLQQQSAGTDSKASDHAE